MRQLSLALLGAFDVSRNGQPLTGFETLKVRALLAYLAMHAERAHTRETLATLLWPDASAELARAYLRQALANLRAVLDERTADIPTLLITRDAVQFNPGAACDLDVAAFRALLIACAQHPHRRAVACTTCARRREQAVSLYRGSFLDQFYVRDSAPFEEWASLTREALHQEAVIALAQLATYHERRGTYDAVERLARRQLALDPWREEAHQQLMRALALSGQRSAALEQYERCRRVLASELGVEPAAETTALYERIRDTASGELSASGDEPQHIQNFPAQTTVLIGRESELPELGALLENSACRLITIVGPGGIGKTRLALQIAADTLDDFPDGAWFVNLAPITDPQLVASAIAATLGVTEVAGQPLVDTLKRFLREKCVLLVLDNFEQVLPAAPLVNDVLASAPQLTVLVTSRALLGVMDESVALFREVGDKPGLANVLLSLGRTAFFHEDYTMGHTYIDEGLRLSRERGDTRGIAAAFHALGIAAGVRGDYPTARARAEASLALYRELGDTGWVASLLNDLGYLLVQQGDGVAAQRLLEESLALVRESGHTGSIATFQASLAMAVLLQGDGARAAGLLKENLALNREMDRKSDLTFNLEGLAAVAAAEQQPVRAGRLWGAAAAVRDAPLLLIDHHIYERWLAPARANVGDEAWQAAVAEGRAMALESAIAYALETGEPTR